MADELEKLVAAARKITMSDKDIREQRRSFAYGNTHIENERITRELVNEIDEDLENRSKK